MRSAVSFFTCLLVLMTNPLCAQLSPQQAVAEMGRGINLGNTLEPPTESAWNNGPAQEAYFDAYQEAGFTNIRIPVRWDEHTTDSAPFAINATWMDRVEEVVDWGLSRGFYITLNGHHEDWLKNNYSNATLRARYDSIWVQVAERFKDKPEKLLFEIINEPKGMTASQVDELNERILGIIRKNNPTRIVIYSGNEWSNSQQLLNAAIPEDDFLIGYYHSYDPWQFAGQGQGTWGTANDYQQMTNQYQSVKNWSDANGIPVHHSEFGAIHACDFNSRMRIYAHNVERCVVNGFAFSVWDDGGDFRVLNRFNNSWPEIKDVLMHYEQDSPNQIFSNFSVDPVTDTPRIVVEWNNRVSGNANIILERSIGVNGPFEQIAELPTNTTSYIDKDIFAGKTYTYRMYTQREDGTLLHGYPTRVRVAATEQTPFNGMIKPIPGTIEVEEYDEGGEGLAYHDVDPNNIPGDFRADEGVDIGAYDNGFILEYVANGEWLEFSVNVTQPGIYLVEAEVASEVANGAFDISFDKNNAAIDFSPPGTGGWTSFQTISANAEIELEPGVQQMRLSITNDNAFNVDRLTFRKKTVNIVDLDGGQAGFKVAPNPSNGFLEVNLSQGLETKIGQLELYRITGEKVASFNTNGASTALDLSAFSSGMYLLQLVGEEVNLVQRVELF